MDGWQHCFIMFWNVSDYATKIIFPPFVTMFPDVTTQRFWLPASHSTGFYSITIISHVNTFWKYSRFKICESHCLHRSPCVFPLARDKSGHADARWHPARKIPFHWRGFSWWFLRGWYSSGHPRNPWLHSGPFSDVRRSVRRHRFPMWWDEGVPQILLHARPSWLTNLCQWKGRLRLAAWTCFNLDLVTWPIRCHGFSQG